MLELMWGLWAGPPLNHSNPTCVSFIDWILPWEDLGQCLPVRAFEPLPAQCFWRRVLTELCTDLYKVSHRNFNTAPVLILSTELSKKEPRPRAWCFIFPQPFFGSQSTLAQCPGWNAYLPLFSTDLRAWRLYGMFPRGVVGQHMTPLWKEVWHRAFHKR